MIPMEEMSYEDFDLVFASSVAETLEVYGRPCISGRSRIEKTNFAN